MTDTDFLNVVIHLHAEPVKPTLSERIGIVGKLIEQFITSQERRPHWYALKRLGDYLLLDTLSDQYKHFKNDEYPFQTDLQTSRRQSKELEYDENRPN